MCNDVLLSLVLRSTVVHKSELEKHSLTCSLYCQHGMIHRDRKKSYVRISKTKYCVEVTDTCEFRLYIDLVRETNRWVLKYTQGKLKKTSNIHNDRIKKDVGRLHTGSYLQQPNY